jgi:DNA-binding MarR family transcriptional regulator
MRNLLGRLIERSPQSLSSIGQFWDVPLEGHDRHRDAGQLYPVLTDAWSLALGWERLTPVEQQVLAHLARAREPIDLDALAPALAQESGTLLPALRRLYRIGLIASEQSEDPDEERPRFYVPTEVAHLLARLDAERAHPPSGTEAPAWFLERLTDVELLEVAERLGMSVLPAVTQRQDAIHFAQRRLLDRRWLAEALAALSPTATRLWGWLNGNAGAVVATEAQSTLGLSFGELRRAIRELAQLGLVWRSYDAQGRLSLLVPEVTRQPQRPRPRPLPSLVEAEAAVSSPLPSPWAAAWDLLTVLRALAVSESRWRPGEAQPPAPVRKRVEGCLWVSRPGPPPPDYLALLGALAHGLGLIDANGRPAPRERLRSWLRFSFPEQGRRLLRAWRRLPAWPERQEIASLGIDWPALRARLLSGLRELVTGQWYLFDSLVARLVAQALVTGRTPIGEPRAAPELGSEELLRRAMTALLEGSLRWMGILDYGRAADNATVVRLSAAGAWILGLRGVPPPQPRGGPALAADEEGWISVIHPSPALVWALSAFADLTELGPPARYRVTRSSLLQAIRSGVQLSQLLRYLEAQLGGPPPGALVDRLERWARDYRPVWLTPAIIVEHLEPGQVERVREHLAQAGVTAERITGERVLVWLPARNEPELAVRRIQQLLRKAGLVPEWRER